MEQDLPVGPVKLKSGKGKDLRTAKLTCHPLWTIWLDKDVEHQSFPRAPQLLVSVAQLRQATRSTGLYVNYCVWGPLNLVSCELVQRSDVRIVRASTRACCPPRLQRATNLMKIKSISHMHEQIDEDGVLTSRDNQSVPIVGASSSSASPNRSKTYTSSAYGLYDDRVGLPMSNRSNDHNISNNGQPANVPVDVFRVQASHKAWYVAASTAEPQLY